MRANVKPLTHWIIYKGYTVRFSKRTPAQVTGTLTTPEGSVEFSYAPDSMRIEMADRTVLINEHGWELEQEAK